MRKTDSKNIAICGIAAALAIIIMGMGGIVPVATYITPVLCTLLGNVIFKICGRRLAWAWYCAVCFLSLLLAPDREAAVVYTFLGCYPCIKPYFERFKMRTLLKLLYFNVIIFTGYSFLLWIFGMKEILQEYTQIGIVGVLILLILGNITFFMLDMLLERNFKRS